MPSNRTDNRLLLLGACLLIASLLVSCSAPKPPPSATAPSSSIEYASTPIGGPVQGQPWIAHLKATDLDQDGLTDFVACDAKLNTVFWIRQTKDKQYKETLLASDMRAPVHRHSSSISDYLNTQEKQKLHPPINPTI